MKKIKSLFEPNALEQNIQKDFSSIISSTPDKERVQHLLPKIKEIERKLKQRKDKQELRRLIQE